MGQSWDNWGHSLSSFNSYYKGINQQNRNEKKIIKTITEG